MGNEWMRKLGVEIRGPSEKKKYFYRIRQIASAEFAHEGLVLVAGMAKSAQKGAEAANEIMSLLENPEWREVYLGAQKRLITAAVIGIGQDRDNIEPVSLTYDPTAEDLDAKPPAMAMWRISGDESWLRDQVASVSKLDQEGSFFRLLVLDITSAGHGRPVSAVPDPAVGAAASGSG
jgi:hypothetical protein